MGVGGVMALNVTGIVTITESTQKTSGPPSQIFLQEALARAGFSLVFGPGPNPVPDFELSTGVRTIVKFKQQKQFNIRTRGVRFRHFSNPVQSEVQCKPQMSSKDVQNRLASKNCHYTWHL